MVSDGQPAVFQTAGLGTHELTETVVAYTGSTQVQARQGPSTEMEKWAQTPILTKKLS